MLKNVIEKVQKGKDKENKEICRSTKHNGVFEGSWN